MSREHQVPRHLGHAAVADNLPCGAKPPSPLLSKRVRPIPQPLVIHLPRFGRSILEVAGEIGPPLVPQVHRPARLVPRLAQGGVQVVLVGQLHLVDRVVAHSRVRRKLLNHLLPCRIRPRLGVGLVHSERLQVRPVQRCRDVRIRIVPPPPELVPERVIVHRVLALGVGDDVRRHARDLPHLARGLHRVLPILVDLLGGSPVGPSLLDRPQVQIDVALALDVRNSGVASHADFGVSANHHSLLLGARRAHQHCRGDRQE
mmetsp:Transcript_62856/g.150379  ORF Transcript_62856/g.150379 Transcript_62856/m.150379 type:complete len:259 (+) Transcript_62856:692-1468(+)